LSASRSPIKRVLVIDIGSRSQRGISLQVLEDKCLWKGGLIQIKANYGYLRNVSPKSLLVLHVCRRGRVAKPFLVDSAPRWLGICRS
jgi:hypothetical protein